MSLQVVDGKRIVDSGHSQTVDHLLKIANTKPFWETVQVVVDTWYKKDPAQYESYIIHLKAVKKDQKTKSRSGGSQWRGVSKSDGIERSLVVDFPVWIDMCLRILYKDNDDVQFDKKFYRSFAKRFPVFRVREKV